MENNKKSRFIGYYNNPVIITYIGIVSAMVGITQLLRNNNLKAALLCLVVAGICDLFDGTVARKFERTDKEKEYGVQIDSLADMICSIAFPTIIFIHSVELNESIRQTINSEILTSLIGSMYMICGAARLAWFNINTASTTEKVNYYTGVPVTYIALILPIMHLVGYIFDLCNLTYYITMFISSILFVSNIKVKKPGKKTYIVFLVLAVIVTIAIQYIIV